MPPRPRLPRLLLSELFTSIQGEGPFTGRPSVFLRLATCNLSCTFCDTPYTWLFSSTLQEKVNAEQANAQPKVYDRKAEITPKTIDQVNDMIKEGAGDRVKALVVTGGEPLLQKESVSKVIDHWLSRDGVVEMETNGTVSPIGLSESVHLNVSPKLKVAGMPHDKRIKYDVLKQIAEWQSVAWKFVVSNESHLDEIDQILNTVQAKRNDVWLMPLGTVCLPPLSSPFHTLSSTFPSHL